ncbi:ANTAR domain-containing protein [Spirillospora sp. CA-253888]
MNEPVKDARSDGIDLTLMSELPGVVHQAAGMVSVQLAITIQAAYDRLTAYARQDGQALEEVAVEVVERRLKGDDLEAPGRPADTSG